MTQRPPPHLNLTGKSTAEAVILFSDWTELAWFPHLGNHGMDNKAGALFVMSLGLGGETGELLEAIADRDLPSIKKELGDVAYYWGRLTGFYGLDVPAMIEAANKLPTIDHRRDPTRIPLLLGSAMGRVQEIIKKSVRDDGLDQAALQNAMGTALGFWLQAAQMHELNPTDILQGGIDKIVQRHATGQLRGSDGSDGKRIHKGR